MYHVLTSGGYPLALRAYQPYLAEVMAVYQSHPLHEAVLVPIPSVHLQVYDTTILLTLTISSLSSHVPYSLNRRPQLSAHVPQCIESIREAHQE